MPSHAPVIKAPSRNMQKASQANKAPAIVHQVVSSPGQTLENDTRYEMENRFNHDFSKVRIHTDARANDSTEAVDALAYTVGNHIVFDQGQYAPNTTTGRQTLSHELTHVVQQQIAQQHPPSDIPLGALNNSAEYEVDRINKTTMLGNRYMQPAQRWPVTLMRQPRSLSAIPLRERRAIQASTMAVTVPTARIDAFFRLMPSGNPGERRSVGATNSYSTTIPAALHVGLGSVGAWVQGDTNALPLNSSIEVDLDLSNHGGSNSTYRFSYFTHRTGRGRRATTNNIMLIELVGNVVAAPAGQAAPTNSFTIGSTSFNLSGSWSNNHYAILRQALSLLTAQALTDAAGVSFRKSSRSGAGGEAGQYDQTTDTITINSNAFPASSMRVGQRSRGAYNILHEIGHALDLRVLERAWQAFNAAGQTASARQTLLRTRSLSGSRYVRDSSGDYNVEQDVSDTSGTFRQAARRDQVRQDTSGRTTTEGTTATIKGGITSYSDTDYQELFSESFALYISAPETLRQLRPNIYNYFNARYPRPRTP